MNNLWVFEGDQLSEAFAPDTALVPVRIGP